MTSPEERRALIDLESLLSRDLSTVEPEELAAGIRDGERAYAAAPEWVGRLVLELRRRGPEFSWPELERITEVPSTTLRNRVRKIEGSDSE